MNQKKEWYAVRHSECGAVSTINPESFEKSLREDGDTRSRFSGKCYNCGKAIFNEEVKNLLIDFFGAKKALLKKGLEISEVKEGEYDVLKKQ